MTAQSIIDDTVKALLEAKTSHPLRVGIDGASASGKTTFADNLVAPLRTQGRQVIRASIDGFHNPPDIRYRQGAHCPVGYVEDSFNKAAVLENVLHPLGPNGNGEYRPSLFDFVSNSETYAKLQRARPDAILIFEGVLLFCDKLAPHFDYRIFVNSDFDTVIYRALKRDSERLGGAEATLQKYRQRYIPGQQEYLNRHSPRESSHLVIDNNDFQRPQITARRPIKQPTKNQT